MRATLIIASLFAAFAAAAPVDVDAPAVKAVEVEARQARTVRVQLSHDASDTAVQREIPANGQRISIKANFGGLGNPIQANRALVVGSDPGSCIIFSDANAQNAVATIKAGAPDARFGNTNLQNGVIVCQ